MLRYGTLQQRSRKIILVGGSFAALNGPLSRELNKRNADAVRSLGVVNAVVDPGPNQTGWADKLRYVESGDLVVVLELGGNGPPTDRGVVAVDRAIFAKRAKNARRRGGNCGRECESPA